MKTTHKVKLWKMRVYKGKTKTTYYVRWIVDKHEFAEPCATSALAKSFESRLVSAMAAGEEFDVESGLPVSMLRESATKDAHWLDFACEFLGEMWPDWSPKHRKSTVESLMHVTLGMLQDGPGEPERKVLTRALRLHLNANTRERDHGPDVAQAIRWAIAQSRSVGELTEPDVLRHVLRSIEKNLDGAVAAFNTFRLRRTALGSAIEFAIERGLLEVNPLNDVKVKKRKQSLRQVDPRSVVNPIQARMLIQAVRGVGKPGPPLVAFFGCMYYAAMRPEEVCALKKENLSLPAKGIGTIYVESACPEVADEWSDNGKASEERSLKHRDDGEGRHVPCPAELTELLHDHLNAFGTARDGRLFRGARDGGRVGSTTYGRAWEKARKAVFTPDVFSSTLAGRPYDLRHAAVSTWLKGGVEPARVAKWAGHSLRVLLEVYAKCLDGGEQEARDRIERALRGE